LCRNPDRGRDARVGALAAPRRELTPEEIAEQNDFSRAWIENVVGVDVGAMIPRRTCGTAFGSCGDSAFRRKRHSANMGGRVFGWPRTRT